MADFAPPLPLPDWALHILKNQTCHSCYAPLPRNSVTQIGLALPRPEDLKDQFSDDKPAGVFFYRLTCRKCGDHSGVRFTTQGLMDVDRFAEECREGESRFKHQPPTAGTTEQNLPPEMLSRLTGKPIKGPPRPSIRQDCPRKPIGRQEVVKFKRRLRVISFNRLTSSFARMMKLLNDYDEPPIYEGK